MRRIGLFLKLSLEKCAQSTYQSSKEVAPTHLKDTHHGSVLQDGSWGRTSLYDISQQWPPPPEAEISSQESLQPPGLVSAALASSAPDKWVPPWSTKTPQHSVAQNNHLKYGIARSSLVTIQGRRIRLCLCNTYINFGVFLRGKSELPVTVLKI